jgi:hypothetical protein
VFTPAPVDGGALDLTGLRRVAVADALALGGGREIAPDPDAGAVERLARWAIERLDAAGLVYERAGREGWWLRAGKVHAESERRLDELEGWGEAAMAGQRRLLEHVDDPGDSGSELEQSLSKLAASGWKVDAKKDKGPPEVFYAAGDLPLARGADWRAEGSIHPRFAAALTLFAAGGAEGAGRLPALAVVEAGEAGDVALLDIRTVAKALRDVGGLDLSTGEPLAPVLAVGAVRLRAVTRKTDGSGPGATEEEAAKPSDAGAAEADAANSAGPDHADPNDVEALIATHGEDAVRFALLHAAAPEKRFRGGEDVVGYAARFLAEARELAAKWLGDRTGGRAEIDTSDGLRRRLAGWCETAERRSAENYERLEQHRATRNAVELLARIRAFEARAVEQRGELAAADREAVMHALALLARLLRPLGPATAAALAGDERAVTSAR